MKDAVILSREKFKMTLTITVENNITVVIVWYCNQHSFGLESKHKDLDHLNQGQGSTDID